jgi:hypothetical protein
MFMQRDHSVKFAIRHVRTALSGQNIFFMTHQQTVPLYRDPLCTRSQLAPALALLYAELCQFDLTSLFIDMQSTRE